VAMAGFYYSCHYTRTSIAMVLSGGARVCVSEVCVCESVYKICVRMEHYFQYMVSTDRSMYMG
jgi:hypothetical protein